MARQPKLDDEQMAELVGMYTDEKMSTTDLSVYFGVSAATLLKYLRKQGVDIRRPGQSSRVFTRNERAYIERRYRGGFGDSPDEIGLALSCVGVTVRNYLKQAELYNPDAPPPNKITFTGEQLEEIIHLHGSGVSSISLSKRFGCSESTMLGTLRRNGVDTSGYGRGERQRLILDRGLWRTCRALTRRMYKSHVGYINPNNLEISPTLHHVDHKLSVAKGLQKGLTVLDLAHPVNLQILTATDNYKKYTKSHISKRELIREIRAWNKEQGDPFSSVQMEVEYAFRYGRYRYFGGSYRTFKGKARES